MTRRRDAMTDRDVDDRRMRSGEHAAPSESERTENKSSLPNTERSRDGNIGACSMSASANP